MAYSYQGNPPLPGNSLNQPPPPPPMNPMQMGMMGPQQGIGMTGPMMTPQGFMQPAPPGTQQQQQQLQLQQMQQMQQLQQMQQMQQNMMNPAMNDAPLEFNVNKNKPPMPIPVEERPQNRNLEDNGNNEDSRRGERDRRGNRGDRRDRDRDRERDRDRMRDRDRNREDREPRQREDKSGASNNSAERNTSSSGNGGVVPENNLQEIPPTPALGPSTGQPQPQSQPQPSLGPAANNMWGGMMGPMGYPMMGMNPMMGGMMGDPNMMPAMGQYGMMGSMMPDGTMLGPDGAMMPMDPTMMGGPLVKEIVHCKSCTLFPPNPNAPPPTTRERPPGCRTIFVGGLPENITEEIIREIFERCGEMQTIRLSKKNFCHIRFVFEASVEAAIYLSGYRIRLGSNTDAPNTGRLHVDYAQARDDLYEWECRQRALQREQRHRERMEQERMRPPSPPPVVHYTDHEALAISEKIKAVDDSFTMAVQVVITWLERGDCNKRNANTFYTMIQSTNSHVRRLLSEKAQFEEELQRARELMKGRMQGLLIQFGQIERVFAAASHKKVWDHFTKAQRKNIEMWKKQTMEIKSVQLEEVLNERADEEMEVSDEEDYMGNKKRSRYDNSEDRANLACVKEENDSLRCQLEAYKNEVDLVRSDMKAEVDQKDKQLKMLQQTLQGMQQQLMETKRRQAEDEMKVRDLQARLRAAAEAQAKKAASEAQIKDKEGDDTGSGGGESTETEEEKAEHPEVKAPTPAAPPPPQITDREAKFIGLISTFLHVHPFGAGVDYVWSYLQKIDPTIRPTEVELLMSRFPTVFRQELSGIGANMERRWQFVGFEGDTSLSSLGLPGLHSV